MKLVWVKYKEFLFANIKIVISVVGSLVLVFSVILPSLSSLPGLYSKNQEMSTNLSSLSRRLGNVNGLVTSQQSVKSVGFLVDRALPSADEVPLLLNQVQAIATSSGVALKSLQFAGISKSPEGGHKKIFVQATMEGSYENIVSVLSNFENTSRLINLSSLSFNSQKSGDALSLTLGLVSYFLENDPKKPTQSNLDLSSDKINLTVDYLKKLKPYDLQVIDVNTGKDNPFE